jgi:hypothetical protein
MDEVGRGMVQEGLSHAHQVPLRCCQALETKHVRCHASSRAHAFTETRFTVRLVDDGVLKQDVSHQDPVHGMRWQTSVSGKSVVRWSDAIDSDAVRLHHGLL